LQGEFRGGNTRTDHHLICGEEVFVFPDPATQLDRDACFQFLHKRRGVSPLVVQHPHLRPFARKEPGRSHPALPHPNNGDPRASRGHRAFNI
jgi:hypothetical protein